MPARKNEPAHRGLTDYGFEFGLLSVERLFDHKGVVAVRIRSRATGEYYDVTASPAGRKLHICHGKHESLKESLDAGRERE